MISTSILRNVSFLVVREKARPDKKHFRKTQRLVVRGWWSAVVIMLLWSGWSGVGGQLLSSCCCGQGLVVSYCHHVAVVRGWWSAIVIMLLWSVVGGQLRTRSLEGPFRGAFGKRD